MYLGEMIEFGETRQMFMKPAQKKPKTILPDVLVNQIRWDSTDTDKIDRKGKTMGFTSKITRRVGKSTHTRDDDGRTRKAKCVWPILSYSEEDIQLAQAGFAH